MTDVEPLIDSLPDPEAARRFLTQLAEKHPSKAKRLLSNDALFSDITTLVSFSPLFATTLLQNPEHIAWLGRKRTDTTVRDKQELLESLARFSLTNSQAEPHVVLARFRRRELMRIFLRDVRRLATIAEITEEISNLADAILEHALRLSRQDLDNRFGSPQEVDERGRMRPAEFCIVSLGKLGSKELNYSSDIDLVFIYSSEGKTSGSGTKGTTTNLEYFSKLAQSITKLVGGQGGEGSAYRVDMRLRPNGRVGPLALPLADTVRYYKTQAAAWERQVLIRSRGSAGSESIFRSFYSQVENDVFSRESAVDDALENVRLSKQKIDLEKRTVEGIDVKLGTGGIREIEFIAQALQLAHGGRDPWLRAPHTLISLTRLSERGHISHAEHTKLFEAYDFLRRLEHILQMENGLQTHLVPSDETRQLPIARRMDFAKTSVFRLAVGKKMASVNRIFQRVFTERPAANVVRNTEDELVVVEPIDSKEGESSFALLELKRVAPRFAAIAESRPNILASLETLTAEELDYSDLFQASLQYTKDFGERLGALRETWTRCLIEIVALDVTGKLSLRECKGRQTRLAEASVEAALHITSLELESRFGIQLKDAPISVLGLGKLGGGGMDYDSDLDLVIVYDDTNWNSTELQASEFFAKAVEIFTNVLSSITRDGSLYRVDLRLRPYGSKGLAAIEAKAILEYMNSTAEIWELLAFVMLRHVGGDSELGRTIEAHLRNAIFKRAASLSEDDLAAETRRVRLALEKQRAKSRRSNEIDIKYGAGGLLDVYFATRYLQLAFKVPNDSENRSTPATLELLSQVVQSSQLTTLAEGYKFLATLDHNLRLTVGRTSRIPAANEHALEVIAKRMSLASTSEIFEELTLYRLAIRECFDQIIGAT